MLTLLVVFFVDIDILGKIVMINVIEKESEVYIMYFVKQYVKFYWEVVQRNLYLTKLEKKSIMYLNK